MLIPWGGPLRRLGAALAAGLAAGRPAGADTGLLPEGNALDAWRNEPGKFYADWHEARCPVPLCVKNNRWYPMADMDILPYSVWDDGELLIPGSVGPPMNYLIDSIYPFDFEKVYNNLPGPHLTRQLWWLSSAASAAYLVLLWAGQSWMKKGARLT